MTAKSDEKVKHPPFIRRIRPCVETLFWGFNHPESSS